MNQMSDQNSNPNSNTNSNRNGLSKTTERGQQAPLIQDEDSINIVDLLDNLLNHLWYFFGTTLFITAIALVYALTATPIYTANSLVQVASKSSGIASMQALSASGGGNDSFGGMSEEIEILRSRTVMSTVVEALRLNVVVQTQNRVPLLGDWLARVLPRDEKGLVVPPVDFVNYAWGGERISIDRFVVPDSFYGQPVLLTVGNARGWTIFDERTSLPLLAGQGAGALVTSEDGLFQIKLDEIEARPGTTFRISVTSPVYSTGAVSGPLSSETIRGTNLVQLSFDHPDPNEAARILNTITDVFFELNLARKSEESQKTLNFLKAELPKLREELDQAELALNQFRASPRTVDVTFELQQLLGASTSIETRLLELELRRRELLLRYDESYPAIQAIDDQKVGLQEQRAAFYQQIEKLPAVQQEFIRFALDVEVNKEMYISLLNSEQQLEIAKASTLSNVAIIDAAITPLLPTKPKKTQIVVIGLVIGLLLGFALTQLLAAINKVVRDPKKLELETGVPTLSILPLDGEQNGRFQSGNQSVFMLSKEAPDGAGVDALRSLRTTLLFAFSEKPRSKVVLITSAVHSQGKSFISANLSYLLGATGKRALLIDADIRKSSLQRYFDFDAKGPGLSSVLRGEKTIDEVIIKGAYENLDFLPPGPQVRSPGDLLAGLAIQAVINDLAQQYDFVVIDSPPLLPVHDSRALGKAADVSLFVARQNAVSLTEVQDAIDVFNKSGNYFDGLIFNGFVPSRVRYGYGYGYGYGGKYATYGKYGKYYDTNADVESSTKK